MSLFGSKSGFLGVDLGTSSIKMVELKEEKGRPRLVSYGFAEKQMDIIRSDSEEAQARIVQSIKQIIKQSSISTAKAVAALPSFAVFTSIISLPTMSKKDLVAAVRWEAKKFVPIPLEEMILDWKVLSASEKETEVVTRNKESAKPAQAEVKKKMSVADIGVKKETGFKVLLTAAPKNLVKRYVEIFKAANLQIISLETEAFALERSLIGNDPASIMIVDIGAIATSISVISGSIPILNRSVDIGGNTITKAIANSLNIDLERAEQFKRDVGIGSGLGSAALQSQIPRTIEFIVSSIVNEIKYVLNIYQNQSKKEVEKIVLAGGSSFLPNLPAYLENLLGIRVFIGDPWARIVYPLELKPVLAELGPRFAAAIGLAMREII